VNCFWFSEPWCGILSDCPVQEGDNVTIGCYGKYEWLAYLLQYNPLVSITSSIEFTQAPETYGSHVPEPTNPVQGRPTPEYLMTTHTIPSVSVGQELEYTCQIQFNFTRRGYSPRNNYALNTLTWDRCTVKETVRCKYIRSIFSTPALISKRRRLILSYLIFVPVCFNMIISWNWYLYF